MIASQVVTSRPARNLAVDLDEPLRGFVPPPRFGTTSFGSFVPAHPSQAAARDRVTSFTASIGPRRQPRLRLPWMAGEAAGYGLYLDGGFGVGKTHLLAAAWHASELPEPKKRYLSFQELAYLLGVLGPERAAVAFAEVRLVCLDEFELDDPGNTLLIARFLKGAFQRGTSVLTTSNTDPEAQGQGRFAAADFQREIQGIASSFEVLAIDGPDHRADLEDPGFTALDVLLAIASEGKQRVRHVAFRTLLDELEEHHPIHYRRLVRDLDVLLVDDVTPLPDQNAALRFVHFIDKVYDLGVHLRATGAMQIEEVFAPSYRNGAYAKKHHRCVSRLRELLSEPIV